jgi:hypothetical protein
LEFGSGVPRSIVATHAKKSLQKTDHDAHPAAFKSRVVLEVLEDKASGLFMVVAG